MNKKEKGKKKKLGWGERKGGEGKTIPDLKIQSLDKWQQNLTLIVNLHCQLDWI